MKREKRTVYLMPDQAGRVNEAAAVGGISPSAIVETALDEHFARESVFGAIEALTRRVGELDEQITGQAATLAKIEAATNALGRGLVGIRELLKPSQPVETVQAPTQAPAQVPDRELEPETASRSGWLGLGRR